MATLIGNGYRVVSDDCMSCKYLLPVFSVVKIF